MYIKIIENEEEVDLTELTDEGLHEAKIQAEELIQDIENEVNSR